MKGVGLAAGIVSLIAGILEMMFGGLLSIYVIMFGIVALAGAIEGKESEPVIVGVVASVVMGAFLLMILAAALLHVLAAIGLLRNKPSKPILWAAAAGSVLPMCTVYCTAISMPAGILLLIYLLGEGPKDAHDPDILD